MKEWKPDERLRNLALQAATAADAILNGGSGGDKPAYGWVLTCFPALGVGEEGEGVTISNAPREIEADMLAQRLEDLAAYGNTANQ